ncbi:MAG: PHP domain-containing protein [Ignavibacteria bacterium]|jgi:predicted metal-dependent phosphoesterase TrpH|nr:PHP domain-containing protein [Ignavibacteria bacterium]MCU7498997.1 PHP domain-containing protein [Ignavibacteria bacterium]MCU7512428.1 PHP domain-containing protein [Ignavibacteria bacterium]MCU7518601.1 PHP domain-containing protein [Ignavibacteria bacterium]MCU7524285.1 PHP domain-containing protein [Ignavibacteria bacterium]
MSSKIDLHLHTTCSDGVCSPLEIVYKAKKAGLDVISITDHDNLAGIEAAAEFGKQMDVEVIPGVEISTDIEDKEVHLLGYFIDIYHDEFQKYLSFFRQERYNRALRIVKKLNRQGVFISIESVLQKAKNGAVGRPHIAQTLIEAGYVNNFYEAFDKYIGNQCPAFERKIHLSPQSALKLISDAGGLSFIAHPGYVSEKILLSLINAGIDGIEVVHPSHNQNQVKYYRGIVNEYCLLASGGSDYHGGKREDEQNLGKFYITRNNLDAMKKMLVKNSA